MKNVAHVKYIYGHDNEYTVYPPAVYKESAFNWSSFLESSTHNHEQGEEYTHKYGRVNIKLRN